MHIPILCHLETEDEYGNITAICIDYKEGHVFWANILQLEIKTWALFIIWDGMDLVIEM